MKLRLIKLDQSMETEVYEYAKYFVKPQNIITFYHLCEFYRLPNLMKVAEKYINCWFTTVAKSDNFLQLDFQLLLKILSCSNLNLTSEIEVLVAADFWMWYNFNVRKKYAEQLLSIVRLALLEEHELENALEMTLSFRKVKRCSELANTIRNDKNSNLKLVRRYCYNTNYDVLCDSRTLTSNYEHYTDKTSFHRLINGKSLVDFQKVKADRNFSCFSTVVYLKGDVYFLNYVSKLVEKYSIATGCVKLQRN